MKTTSPGPVQLDALQLPGGGDGGGPGLVQQQRHLGAEGDVYDIQISTLDNNIWIMRSVSTSPKY